MTKQNLDFPLHLKLLYNSRTVCCYSNGEYAWLIGLFLKGSLLPDAQLRMNNTPKFSAEGNLTILYKESKQNRE
jgi:hypothetical protein